LNSDGQLPPQLIKHFLVTVLAVQDGATKETDDTNQYNQYGTPHWNVTFDGTQSGQTNESSDNSDDFLEVFHFVLLSFFVQLYITERA
jgi:hypothetical protein